MRHRLRALSLLVTLSIAGTFVSTSSALASSPNQPTTRSGSIGIRLLAVPGASSNDLFARLYVVDRLAPGTSIRRSVRIDNNTSATANVAVYPAAASIVRGSFTFAPSRSRNELSSWTSLSSGVLHLAPGAAASDTVTINVPRKASSGERYAVVWAEVSAPSPAGSGVTLVNRVGVRMYLSVGPGGAPPSNFTVGSLRTERSATGEPLVVSTVHNSGKATLDFSGNLTLSKGPGGLGAGPYPITLGTVLAPGASEPVIVKLDSALPRGPWRADLVLTSGHIQRSAVATITFPRLTRAKVIPPSLLILALVVLLMLLAVISCALVLSRRHRLVLS